MMNYYALEVYKKQGKPCFVVTVLHEMLTSVLFFNTLEEAKSHIETLKNELSVYGELHYNPDGCTDEGHAKVIKIVLSCDTIKIGKNGRTYSEELFNC